LYILIYINYTSDKMNINAPDAELADLMQRPDVIIPNNNGRANPVGQRLQQPQQPQTIRLIGNNWTPNMPANGGYRTTTKNSKKYKNKNKNRKNKNRKRRQTKRLMKK
jgi:hypothetical protein